MPRLPDSISTADMSAIVFLLVRKEPLEGRDKKAMATYKKFLEDKRRYQELEQLVCGRRREKADISMFCVPKKGDLPRLIIDARQVNSYHKVPPSTRMASAEKLCSLSVHPDVLYGCHTFEGSHIRCSCRVRTSTCPQPPGVAG